MQSDAATARWQREADRMPKPDALRGAYCPLVVPFRAGKIDFDTYGQLIERQIAEGTHGLLVNATSGEPTMLTLEERAQVVEFVIKTSAGRLPSLRWDRFGISRRERDTG